METKYFNSIYTLFQVCCFAPPIKPNSKGFFNLITAITTGSIIFYTFLAFYNFQYLRLPIDFTGQAIIKWLLTSCNLVALESFYTRSNHLRILNKLNNFDINFQKLSNYVLDTNYCLIKLIKVCSVTFCIVGYFVLGSYFYYYQIEPAPCIITVIFLGLAKIIIHMKLIQNSYYLDLIIERLQRISNVLARRQSTSEPFTIENARWMYGQLWEIISEINLAFRWSIVVIVIENILDLTNDAQILYVNIIGAHKMLVFCGKCVF